MREVVDIRGFLKKNAVTVMFILLCAVCLALSGQPFNYVMFELVSRISRNAFIVLALIIPIIAGMGINFAITIGAMAAQIAVLWVLEWGIPGIGGFLVAAAMTVPIAGFFGYLIGNLLNKMKGQEMIGSMILGFFANGLYQLLFLFIFGNLIPLHRSGLVIKGSTGVANTMDLSKAGGLKYALDGLWRLKFEPALYVFAGLDRGAAGVDHVLQKRSQGRAYRHGGGCAGRGGPRADSGGQEPVFDGVHPDDHVPRGRPLVPVQRGHHAHAAGAAVPRGRPEAAWSPMRRASMSTASA